MVSAGTVCLRRAAGGDRGRIVQFGRFLGHAKVTPDRLIEHWGELTGLAAVGRDVLAVQDTSEIGLSTRPGQRRGLGPIGKGNKHGLLLHAMLALDAGTGQCLGLVDGRIWTRAGVQATPHQQRPPEERESERWLATARAAGEVLEAAHRVTVVADRESDIYAAWATLPGPRLHLLSRAMSDRRLVGGGCLFSTVAALPPAGTRALALAAQPGRPARTAGLSLRFGSVLVRRPDHAPADLPAQVGLRVVQVHEDNPPAGVEPLSWTLLTTHAVENADDAWHIVTLYTRRWVIEQFFRLLKSQGLGLEDSQVESAQRLEKLTAIAARAAVILLQLVQARDGMQPEPASVAFLPHEIKLLDRIQTKRYQPRTPLQKNPHHRHSLAWATWIIARLGGWDGYPKSRKPGPITIANGLKIFQAMSIAWALKDM